jgi:FKBP-type peptidyl-prolyl cis-trans isomerase FkpA
MIQKYWFITVFYFLFFISCSNTDKEGFQTTKSGLKYKFFAHDEKARKIKAGMYVEYQWVIKNANDSITVNTFTQPTQKTLYIPNPQGGGMSEALSMMAVGDSAIFKVSCDRIYNIQKESIEKNIADLKKTMPEKLAKYQPKDSMKNVMKQRIEGSILRYQLQLKQLREQYPEGKYITYLIKVHSAITEADATQLNTEMQKKQAENRKKQIEKEKKDILKYIKKHHLKAQFTSSGLYYVILKKGEGKKPEPNETVKLYYTGKFLDGKIFDTNQEKSAKKYKLKLPPNKFKPLPVVMGQNQVIPGFEEGIKLLPKGSKAIILIPSRLGYGEKGIGNVILPNTPLVFEIEVLS